MANFTDRDLLKLDERFAQEGIPFHARPFHAAIEILGKRAAIAITHNPQFKEIEDAYARLIPEVEFTWPGMGTGLVASVDQVRKVTIGLAFGVVNITIDTGLGFSSYEEWISWCRNDRGIINRSAFAFADMHDLVNGINCYRQQEKTLTFWRLAAEQLRIVAESLSQSGYVSSPVLQPICLTVELALKGTLLHFGIAEDILSKQNKGFGHNLANLGLKMIQECNHRDDILLIRALDRFPEYVKERYQETQLTRLDVITLALDAQFIAASAIRRVSGYDLALQIEDRQGPRSIYFP